MMHGVTPVQGRTKKGTERDEKGDGTNISEDEKGDGTNISMGLATTRAEH